MRIFFLVLFLSFFILVIPNKAFAESSYVLPYPSSMPGSIWYKLDLVKEKLMKYWYFGDFANFDYNLAESDRYLVAAKTLFEYKQYLLGYNSLLRSDSYFKKVLPSLLNAKKHNKDTKDKSLIYQSASEKHIETLEKMRNEVPETFIWTPEKDKPTNLDIGKSIENSIKIRSVE